MSNALPGNFLRRLRPRQSAAWIVALWLLEAALLIVDMVVLPEFTLIGYFLVPSLIAAAFAPPRQVLWLAVASVVSGIISGWRFDTLFTAPYLVRLGALAVIGAFAVLLAVRRERQKSALSVQTDLLQGTLDSLLDPHILLRAIRDENGKITDFVFADANEAACAYNRLPRAQYVGRRLLELLPAHTATGLFHLYCRVIESGRPLALDDFLYPHEIHEQPRYYDIRAVKVGDALSFTWRDVTDRHYATEKLQQHARTDELTKLLNRREVFERLEDLRGKSPRTGRNLAVLFVDFDHFKNINDTYGHAAGDEVLLMFFLAYIVGVFITLLAVLITETSRLRTASWKDFWKLIAAVFFDNLGFHQFRVLVSLWGTVEYLIFRRRDLGAQMERLAPKTKPA